MSFKMQSIAAKVVLLVVAILSIVIVFATYI